MITCVLFWGGLLVTNIHTQYTNTHIFTNRTQILCRTMNDPTGTYTPRGGWFHYCLASFGVVKMCYCEKSPLLSVPLVTHTLCSLCAIIEFQIWHLNATLSSVCWPNHFWPIVLAVYKYCGPIKSIKAIRHWKWLPKMQIREKKLLKYKDSWKWCVCCIDKQQ